MLDAFPFDSDKMMASSSRLGSERYDEFQMESDRMSSNRLPHGSGHHTLGTSSMRSPIASSRGASTHGSGHFRAFSSDKDGVNSMRSDVERELFNEFEINNGDSMRSKDGFQMTPQQSGTLYDKVFASSRSDVLDVSAEKRILQPFIHHQLSSATMDSTKSMDTFGDFGMDVSAKSIMDSYRSDMSADTVTRRQLLDFFETTESGKSLDDSAKRMLIDYFDGNDSAKSNESVSKKELFDHFGNSEHARKMDTHTRNRFFEGFAQFHVGYPHFHISKPHVPQMPTILSAHSSFSLGSFFHHNDENHPNGHSSNSSSNGHHHGFGGEGGGHGAATGQGHGSNGEYHNNILSGIWMSKQNHQMHHDEVPLHEGGTTSEKYRPTGNTAATAATTAHDDEQPQTRHRHSSFSGVMPQLWHKKPHKSPSTLSSHPEHESHGHHSSSQTQYPMDPIQAALMSVQQQFQFTPHHQQPQSQPQPTLSPNQPTPHPSMFPQQPQQQPMTPSLYPASIGPPNTSATGNQLHRAQSMMAIPTVFNFYGAANGAPGVLPPMDIKTLPRTHSAPGSTMLPHVQQFQFNAAAAAAAGGAVGAGGQMRLPALNHPAPVSNGGYPAHALLQQTHLSPRLPPLNAAGQSQPFHTTTNSQPFAHSANGFVASVSGGGGGGGGGYASHLGHSGGHLGGGSNGSSLSSLTDSAATTTTITVDPISGTLKPIEILRPVVKEKPSSSAAAGGHGGGGGGGHGAADKRGAYRCGKCGQPKADHVCKFIDKTFKSRGAQVYHPIFNLATNTPFPGEKFLTVRSARTSIHDTPPMMASATAVPSFTMPQHYPSGSMASGTGTPPIYSVPTIQMLRARNDLSGISDDDRHVKSEVTISVHQSMKSTLASDSTKSAHIDLSDANGGGGDDDEYGSFGIATGMDTGSSSKMNMMVSDEAVDGSGRFQYNGSRLNGSGDGGGDGDGGGGEGEEDDFEFCQEISSMPQKFVTNSRNSSVKASRGRAVTTLLLEEDEETDGDGSTTFDSEHTGKFTPSPSKKFQPSDSAMMVATPDFVT
jgi:hypothetical protein